MTADPQAILAELRKLKANGTIRRGCLYSDGERGTERLLVVAPQPATAARHRAIHEHLVAVVRDPAVPVLVRWEGAI